nr:hypothetical protein [uncultured Dysosmobacter sp.]
MTHKHERLLPLCALLLCTALALTPVLSRRQSGVPSLERLETLTEETALDALSGFSRGELLDAWGSPRHTVDALSSQYADCYDAPTRGGWIVVRYDTHDTVLRTPALLDTLPVWKVDLQVIG